MKSADFRRVYQQGIRVNGPYFVAFCLTVPRPDQEGPRIGFTVPRAFGKATRRNRVKRRIREILRVRLSQLDPHLDLVINPRRPALDASSVELQKEVERVISRCVKS